MITDIHIGRRVMYHRSIGLSKGAIILHLTLLNYIVSDELAVLAMA